MTKQTKIRLEQSETRQKINAFLAQEELTDADREAMGKLTKRSARVGS